MWSCSDYCVVYWAIQAIMVHGLSPISVQTIAGGWSIAVSRAAIQAVIAKHLIVTLTVALMAIWCGRGRMAQDGCCQRSIRSVCSGPAWAAVKHHAVRLGALTGYFCRSATERVRRLVCGMAASRAAADATLSPLGLSVCVSVSPCDSISFARCGCPTITGDGRVDCVLAVCAVTDYYCSYRPVTGPGRGQEQTQVSTQLQANAGLKPVDASKSYHRVSLSEYCRYFFNATLHST